MDHCFTYFFVSDQLQDTHISVDSLDKFWVLSRHDEKFQSHLQKVLKRPSIVIPVIEWLNEAVAIISI